MTSVPNRLPPGRVVAIASAVVVLVVVALWLARSAPTTDAAAGSVRSTATSVGSPTTPDSGLATVAESRLPQVARDTLALVRAGGPFPYEEDGRTFQNREGILPDRARGYYREYTVKKGRGGDRGPLRLVRGEGGDVFWTDDHYDSFRQVQEGR
jgi:ribonuclease T1